MYTWFCSGAFLVVTKKVLKQVWTRTKKHTMNKCNDPLIDDLCNWTLKQATLKDQLIYKWYLTMKDHNGWRHVGVGSWNAATRYSSRYCPVQDHNSIILNEVYSYFEQVWTHSNKRTNVKGQKTNHVPIRTQGLTEYPSHTVSMDWG